MTLLLLALLFGLWACSGPAPAPKLKVGDPAPDFTATDLSGKPVRLADFKGKPVILRFWSTECRFCRADTPIFNRYFEKYRDAGLGVFYINRQGDEKAVRDFVADLEVGFPVILDRDGAISAAYNIKIEPQTIIIDPRQRIVGAILGGIGEEEFQKMLGKYLRIEASTAPAADTSVKPSAIAEPSAQERCPVCGMFVAKYPQWLTRMAATDGTVRYFDGVKDLMAFFFEPSRYGGNQQAIGSIQVKDYYSLEWLDGRNAFYVVGSDVHGPMGHELIPFASQTAAESFRKDHKGGAILGFAEISSALIESLRHGQRMR